MTPPEHTSDSGDLGDVLPVLWSRKWLILAIVVTATALTYLWRESLPPQYESGTSIYLQRADVPDPLAQIEGTAPIDDRATATQAALLRSSEIGDRVRGELRFRGTTRDLLKSISVAPVEGSDFLNIVATRPDRQEAANVANAFARVFIEFRTSQYERQIEASIATARLQLEQARGATLEERTSLREQLRRLQFLAQQPAAGARQVDEAVAPNLAVSPKPKRDAAFAAAMSLLLAIGLAFLLARLDRRLKTVEDVDAEFAAPILAAVPRSRHTHASQEGAAVISEDLTEAFRVLRMNLSLNAMNRPIRKLLITSALPGEGKSTVARNLAVLYREWGMKVALVDADLRRPRLQTMFGVSPQLGMLDVLMGDAPLAEALHPLPVRVEGLDTLARIRDHEGAVAVAEYGDGANGHNGSGESLGSLSLLAGGGTPANPAAVLAADEARSLLDRLAETHDTVVIDSAPLLAVADSVPLLSQVDGVVVVVRLGETTRDSVRRTTELLERVPESRLLGVVVNGVDERSLYGYSY